MDKVAAGLVTLGLFCHGFLEAWHMGCMLARDIAVGVGILVIVPFLPCRPAARSRLPGKIATNCQVATAIAALFRFHVDVFALLTLGVSMVAILDYGWVLKGMWVQAGRGESAQSGQHE
jgi:hypothetical protein